MKRGGPDGGREDLSDDRQDEPKRRRRDRDRDRAEADDNGEPLNPETLDRMITFLDVRGGSFDYGRFAAEFPRLRKRQLEPHFDFVPIDGKASGRWLIQLPGVAPDVERDLPLPRPSQDHRSQASSRRRRSIGDVVFWDRAKGYGFIKCPEETPQDIFFPKGALPPNLQDMKTEELRGLEVTFDFCTNTDGKPRAESISRTGGSGGGSGGSAGTQILTGRVRKFDRAKGYGFITVPGEQDDVFFLPSALPKDIPEDKVQGMEVSLEFFVNEEGKPRAQRIWRSSHAPPQPPPQPPPQFMGMPPPMMMGPPPHMGMPGMPPPMGMMHHPPMPPYPTMAMPSTAWEEPRYRGKVISYDLSKGYGFISAEGLPHDVFFKKSELPVRLRDAQDKGAVQGATFEFEVQAMPDGKYRARQIVMAAASKSSRGGSTAGRARRPATGRIIAYRDGKGFGFIKSKAATENVFFLRSTLPQEYREDEGKLRGEVLIGLHVAFELYTSEEGKPRADRVQVMSEEEAAAKEADASRGVKEEEELQVLTGQIVRYDVAKGYGFIRGDSDAHHEDIFFLKAQLPREMANPKLKEDVEKQQVVFKVLTMPDGKLRACDMELRGHGESRTGGEEAADELQLLPDVFDFIVGRGGSCEYDDVTREFPTVPLHVLEQKFDITDIDGILRIQLLESQDLAQMDEAPLDEDRDPAIPLGPGCQPVGKIRAYDPVKGFGFIVCQGLDEDIFFPFKALPENFRGRHPSELPSLKDVHVSMDLIPGDRGLRAETVNLLLKWHAGDKCWLLKRS